MTHPLGDKGAHLRPHPIHPRHGWKAPFMSRAHRNPTIPAQLVYVLK